MDDGFHKPLSRQRFSVMVSRRGRGVGNGRVIPAGPMRGRSMRSSSARIEHRRCWGGGQKGGCADRGRMARGERDNSSLAGEIRGGMRLHRRRLPAAATRARVCRPSAIRRNFRPLWPRDGRFALAATRRRLRRPPPATPRAEAAGAVRTRTRRDGLALVNDRKRIWRGSPARSKTAFQARPALPVPLVCEEAARFEIVLRSDRESPSALRDA